MWATCIENRAFLRAFRTACRGHSTHHAFRGVCRGFRRMEQEFAPGGGETASPGAAAAGAEEEEPSWIKRGMLSLWPPIVPPR